MRRQLVNGIIQRAFVLLPELLNRVHQVVGAIVDDVVGGILRAVKDRVDSLLKVIKKDAYCDGFGLGGCRGRTGE